MKHLLLTTIAVVVLVGCGESQQPTSAPETPTAKPVVVVPAQPSSPQVEAELTETVAEAAQPEPTTPKAPDISIHDAAGEGDIEAVKQYLSAGADVNEKAVNWNGFTPLHLAAGMKGHKEIVELLLAKGADVNAKNESGSTPLFGAFNGEIVELLIAKGSNVNARTGVGQTPLLSAVIFGQKEIVKILIAKGADLHARDDAGVTPLDMTRNNPEIAEILAEYSIYEAVNLGNIEAVKQHLAAGLNVNAKIKYGSTALHSAAEEGHKEIVELLLAKGADVNTKSEDGETPLDWADGEIVYLLRKHGGKTGEELKAEAK